MENKSALQELGSECWSQIKTEKVTIAGAYAFPALVSYALGEIGKLGSIIQAEQVKSMIGKDLLIGVLGGTLYLVYSSHMSIKKRDSDKIAALEAAKDDLRITPDVDVSQAGSYLRIKIHNAGNAVTGIRATLINLRKTANNDTLPDTIDLRLSGSRQSPTDIGHKQTVFFDIAAMIGSPRTRCFSVMGMLGTKEQALYMSSHDRAFEVDITGTNIAGRRFEVYATVGGTITLGPHRLTLL